MEEYLLVQGLAPNIAGLDLVVPTVSRIKRLLIGPQSMCSRRAISLAASPAKVAIVASRR